MGRVHGGFTQGTKPEQGSREIGRVPHGSKFIGGSLHLPSMEVNPTLKFVEINFLPWKKPMRASMGVAGRFHGICSLLPKKRLQPTWKLVYLHGGSKMEENLLSWKFFSVQGGSKFYFHNFHGRSKIKGQPLWEMLRSRSGHFVSLDRVAY